jgi:excisionase family DNA binding protein
VEQLAALLTIVPGTTQRLSCGRSTVYKLIESGELETVKMGRRRLVVAESVAAYVERLRAAA